MSKETARLKAQTEARLEEVQQTVSELGERVEETKVFFVAGVAAGVVGLFLLNRIIFRRIKKILRWGRCGCS
ncbi:MAG: hypothetical protein C4534_09985 [Gaiellales bacterium]|nr:MAG: hypothetical protein C4534_09985 [Gaiellales bacterium]